jgi:hypothetical protein
VNAFRGRKARHRKGRASAWVLGSRNFLMQMAIADAKENPPADRTAYDLFALGY